MTIYALGFAVVFGGIGAANWWSSREDLRAGSKVVSQAAKPLEIEKVPTTYAATYRFENRARDEVIISTEKVWVKRPFASRVESYKGPVASGRPGTVRQSVFGTLSSRSEGGSEPLNIAAPPSVASGDIRIDAILEEAVRSKAMVIREQREVIGRHCQVYRAGSSVLAGDVPIYKPGGGDYADVCIDANGIILEEYWVQDDEPLRRRVALSLRVGLPLDNDLFEVEVEATPGVKRGLVERVKIEPSNDGTPLWTLGKPPAGFDSLGRYAVVLSPDAVPSTGGMPGIPPTSTSDVYIRGPDIIVVDQDPSLATIASFEGRPIREIKLDRLRNAKLIVDARMSEVRAETGDGSLVRILGTVPSEELIDLANRLRPRE